MWMDFCVALICIAALLVVAWSIKGRLLTPVSYGKNTELTLNIKVKADEPALENTLKSLVWLNECDTLRVPIVISFTVRNELTEKIAETYADKYYYISVADCGESKWKNSLNLTE